MIQVYLSLNQEVYLQDISTKYFDKITLSDIIKYVQLGIEEHYYHFGTKPFTLEFSPKQGYFIRATSSVGKVHTGPLEIVIESKLPGLDIGKCIGLAQSGKNNSLKINSNSLTRSMLSDEISYSTTDFFAFGLLDAVLSIRHNGLARTFQEIFSSNNKIKGNIDIQQTINQGRSLLSPIICDVEPNYDIFPNQIIAKALDLCASTSGQSEIIKLAQIHLLFFEEHDVQTNEVIDPASIEFISHQFNLPRKDYEKAFSFAVYILKKNGLSIEGELIDIPSFTLDMDVVFEEFVGYQLLSMLDENFFDVYIQPEFNHVILPEITSKKIIPDIIIKNKNTGKVVIVDTKNKYSQIAEKGIWRVSNNDLYQMSYYAHTLNTDRCILVYPSLKPPFQFPINLGSKSKEAFEKDLEKGFDKVEKNYQYRLFDDGSLKITPYYIDLSGSLLNSKKSAATLCQLILYMTR